MGPNLWDRSLAYLKNSIDVEHFDMWLRPTRYRSSNGNALQIEVPSVHFRDWIQSNCMDKIRDAVNQTHGTPLNVEFIVGSEIVGALSAEETATAETLPGVDHFSTPFNAKYTFENFIVGESNRFAHAAAMSVADPESRAYNPLFIYGGSGVGKTHLMHAIGLRLKEKAPHLKVLYATSEQFFNSFINTVYRAMQSSKVDPTSFRSLYRGVDLLMIDDIQFFIGKEGTQTEFFHTFNALYDAGKKIVISSDRPPMELTTLEERLKSRFMWGLNVDIQAPDLETRIAILTRKARAANIAISPEVIFFVAERVQSNVRNLEGALNRLQAHAALDNRSISMELAQGALVDLVVTPSGPKIQVDDINQEVCNYFSIRLHELIGPGRQKKYAMARHVAMYLCRKMTDLSLPDLAARFGGRNHTTVLHACKKIERDLQKDTNLQNIVNFIERAVRGANS